MRKKTLFPLLLLCILLAACGPSPEEQAAQTATARTATAASWTKTSTLTPTDSSTVTPSLTITSSPTSTPTGVPEYFHGTPRSIEDFTLITSEWMEAAIKQDIVDHPLLDRNVHDIRVQESPTPLDGSMSFVIICTFGYNCMVRAAVAKNIPGVGEAHILYWEATIVDGQSTRVFFATCANNFSGYISDENWFYSQITQASGVGITLFFNVTASVGGMTDPVLRYYGSLTDQEAFTRFIQGGNALDFVFILQPLWYLWD